MNEKKERKIEFVLRERGGVQYYNKKKIFHFKIAKNKRKK